MGKNLVPILLLLRILYSCEQEIQVNAPPEFIPVVYCLLDPDKDVQTLRISRVFQDKNGYSEWDDTYDSNFKDTSFIAYIEMVDGSGERSIWWFSYVEEMRSDNDSVFAITQIFETTLKPILSTNYQMYVYFPVLQTMVSASTLTVSNVSIIDPMLVPGRKLVILPNQPYTLRWIGSQGTSYYQGIFKINYLEKELNEIRSKSIEIVMRPILQEPDEGFFNQNLTGTRVLKSLRDKIKINASITRKIINVDFSLYYGGVELALFSHTGVDPAGPMGMALDYSNLDNARGVFSSLTSKAVYSLALAEQTIDTIALHLITKPLNFLEYDEDF